MRWTVYALSDPSTGLIRYVGITTRTLSSRVSEHIYNSTCRRTHCASWVKSLTRKGLRPVPLVLETGDGAGWADAERKWIASYRAAGADLTNHTDGGEGTLGYSPPAAWRFLNGIRARLIHTGLKRTAESCARMREAQIKRFAWEQEQGISRTPPPRSAETRKRLADAQRGKKASAETRQRMSDNRLDPQSAHQSDAYKEKQRQAILARPPEQRAAFAHNQKGVPKSEEHRRKIAEAHRGKSKHTEATRQRLRELSTGKVQSEEHRRKKAEACKATWARKRLLAQSEAEDGADPDINADGSNPDPPA